VGEVALPRLQSEIKVALFLFASHSFLANNLKISDLGCNFHQEFRQYKFAEVCHDTFVSTN
jgi:hypothetical protein